MPEYLSFILDYLSSFTVVLEKLNLGVARPTLLESTATCVYSLPTIDHSTSRHHHDTIEDGHDPFGLHPRVQYMKTTNLGSKLPADFFDRDF